MSSRARRVHRTCSLRDENTLCCRPDGDTPAPGRASSDRRNAARPHPILDRSKTEAARRPFHHRLIVRETKFQSKGPSNGVTMQELPALAADEDRNALIVSGALNALAEGRSP